jgi:hypothetical protein
MGALILGILDVAYSDASTGQPTTTGDVAEILEAQYGVMNTFFESRKEQIAGYLADSMANALQDALNGRATRSSPTYGAEQQIEAEFRSFLDSNEMQIMTVAAAGVPLSQAAAQGVNHRKKMPYSKRNKPRPAFIDSGLYRASFRAVFKP